MTTGFACPARPGCPGLVTSRQSICLSCQHEQRLAAMRQSCSPATRALARVLTLIHREPELEAGQ